MATVSRYGSRLEAVGGDFLQKNTLSHEELQEFYSELQFTSVAVRFEREFVPEELRALILYAEFWGLEDDWARQDLVLRAPEEIRLDLKRVLEMYDDELDEWLAGPEAMSASPSNAYIAFSAMRMAADFI